LEVFAVTGKQVEGIVLRPLVVPARTQRVEIRNPVRTQDDDLAIEYKTPLRQRHRSRDLFSGVRELVSSVRGRRANRGGGVILCAALAWLRQFPCLFRRPPCMLPLCIGRAAGAFIHN
jgi:hypothetical protein